jgi:hypothetical protein
MGMRHDQYRFAENSACNWIHRLLPRLRLRYEIGLNGTGIKESLNVEMFDPAFGNAGSSKENQIIAQALFKARFALAITSSEVSLYAAIGLTSKLSGFGLLSSK